MTWTSADIAALAIRRAEKQKSKTAAPKPKPESANRITANVKRIINSTPGCVCYRVNNTGIWDEKKKLFRRAHTEKGLPDVWAIVRGRACCVEVKAGRDKLSEDQLKRKFEIERAGGLFYEARSTDGFSVWFTGILKGLP